MKFTLVSGTGNHFALFDGFADECPEDAERQEAEARQMNPVPTDGTGASTRV